MAVNWTPDIESYVRTIPEFDGQKQKLEPFLEAVDYIAPAIEALPAAAAPYYLQKIKTKLVGKARLILDLNTDVQTWPRVKQILISNFGEKRNIFALTEELRNTKFTNDPMSFLNEIRFRLRNVISKARNEINEVNALNRDVNHFRSLALKVFINGLPESHSTILYARNPGNLEEAERILGETDHLFGRKIKVNNNPHPRRPETNEQQNSARHFTFTGNRDFRNPQNNFRNNFNNFRHQSNNNFRQNPNNFNNPGRNFNNNLGPNRYQNSNNPNHRHPNNNNFGQGPNRTFGESSRQTRQQQPRPEPMDTSTNTISMNRDFPKEASEPAETSEFHIFT